MGVESTRRRLRGFFTETNWFWQQCFCSVHARVHISGTTGTVPYVKSTIEKILDSYKGTAKETQFGRLTSRMPGLILTVPFAPKILFNARFLLEYYITCRLYKYEHHEIILTEIYSKLVSFPLEYYLTCHETCRYDSTLRMSTRRIAAPRHIATN